MDAILMMRPYLRSIMCRPKTWHARNVPVRFVSMSLFQSASEKSRVGARWLNPAALRRMSTFPNASTEACSNFSNDPRSATSELTRSDRRPIDSISSSNHIHKFQAPRAGHDIGTGFGQSARKRAADSGTAPDHNRYLTIEFQPLISHASSKLSRFSSGHRLTIACDVSLSAVCKARAQERR